MSSKQTSRLHAAVDQVLLEHGAYVPVELLLNLERLPYDRYEAWRCGDFPLLEDALAGNVQRIYDTLQIARDWAQRLGLQPRLADYRGWAANNAQALRFSHDPKMDALLRTHYQRSDGESPQLDLFLDSSETVVLNDVREALVARQPQLAEECLQQLLDRAPQHRLRPAAERLCAALSHLGGHLDTSRPADDPYAELHLVEHHLTEAADELLGARSRDFLAPFWRRLAEAFEGAPFDPQRDHAHASFICRQCFDWKGVRRSVLAAAGHLHQPVLLARLAEAERRLGHRNQAIQHWCRLCWQLPREAGALLDQDPFPDPAVQEYWNNLRDQDFDPEPDATYLPVWILLEEPGLARALPSDLAANSTDLQRAFRALQQLLRNPDSANSAQRLELRKQLRDAHEGLFSLYLARCS